MPGSGLISERSHTAGENIHCEAFGWVREVLALNGHSTVRLRPSAPTASLTLRIADDHARYLRSPLQQYRRAGGADGRDGFREDVNGTRTKLAFCGGNPVAITPFHEAR